MGKEDIAYCGLYCGTCGLKVGLIRDRAKKLKEVVEAYKFEEWVPDFFEEAGTQLVLDQAIMASGYSEEDLAALKEEMEKSKFDFAQFMAGLEWFTKVDCPGCLEEGGSPLCQVRRCVMSREIRGCWECEKVEECLTVKKFEERSAYAVRENLNDIRKSGEEAYAKKMDKKKAAGFDNVLDRKPFGPAKDANKRE